MFALVPVRLRAFRIPSEIDPETTSVVSRTATLAEKPLPKTLGLF